METVTTTGIGLEVSDVSGQKLINVRNLSTDASVN